MHNLYHRLFKFGLLSYYVCRGCVGTNASLESVHVLCEEALAVMSSAEGIDNLGAILAPS